MRYSAYDFLLMFYSNYTALSRDVSEIVNVEKSRDLEVGSKVTQGDRKWYHSIDCVWFPVSVL